MDRSYGVGRYSASEGDAVCRSRTAGTGQRGVLCAGGRGATTLTRLHNNHDEQDALTGRGFVVMEGDWSGSTHFGSPTAQARLTTGKTYLQAAPWSASSGQVGILAYSMGSLLALLYALANPANVFALALALPLVNLLDFYDDNAIYQAEIAAAHGGAPTSTVDPLSRAAEFDLPLGLWASSDDTLTTLADAEAFRDAANAAGGQVELVNMGAQGHTTYAAFAAEAADFLAEHA